MTGSNRRSASRPVRLAVAAVCLALASCSPDPGRPPLHPVSGSATFRGKAAVKAVVVLRPVSGAKGQLPHAEVGEDGTFRIGTYADADGAPAGEYLVTVTWPEVKTDARTGDEVVTDRLQRRFDDPQKGLRTVTVREGDNRLEPFRLD